VIQRKLLPGLILALAVLAACSGQAGSLTPALPAGIPPVSASPATPVPASTTTPISTAAEAPISSVLLPVVASPALARIDFQDENSGWGIAVNDNGYVLRTVDGGRTWLNASPPGIAAVGLSAALTVLNTNTAWVLVPGTDFFSGTLYRTGNGGISWRSNPVPFGGALLQFQDGSSGRALADRGARAGSDAVELFQTSDGGATWVSVFHDDPGLPGSSDNLPLAGIKNGMTFTDPNTGWVTGFIQADGPADADVYLYITHDGGASWSHQSVPIPKGYETYQYMPQAPVFFGKDGFLPMVIYQSGTTDLTFYTTHDGGLSWTGDPANTNQVIKPGLPAVADMRHIWSWDGGPSLYYSSDGAQTWNATASTLDLSGNLSRLEYVTGAAGRFTGWALTRLDENGHSQLYRSSDGTNWRPLIP
jgi:photosystem II stability/assembly factor-like uncharacterized protein